MTKPIHVSTKTTGKLQAGLTCHHKFNTDTLHFITTEIEKNTDKILFKICREWWQNCLPLSQYCLQQNLQNLGREKKAVPKPIGARFMLQRLERREPVSYFCPWGARRLRSVTWRNWLCNSFIAYICNRQSFFFIFFFISAITNLHATIQWKLYTNVQYLITCYKSTVHCFTTIQT